MFGKTIETTVRFNSGENYPLQVRVSAPVVFKPTDPADAKQAVNVYFTVTIRNLATAPYELSGVIGEADCGSGYDLTAGDLIVDLDQHIEGVDGAPTLKPGQSLTFKDGYSVASLDNLRYTLRPAGRAADTLEFQRAFGG